MNIFLAVKLRWQWKIMHETGNASFIHGPFSHCPPCYFIIWGCKYMTQHLPPTKKTIKSNNVDKTPADFSRWGGSGLQTTKAFLILAFNALENLKKLLQRHGPVIRQCRQSWWINQNQNSPLKPTIKEYSEFQKFISLQNAVKSVVCLLFFGIYLHVTLPMCGAGR